MEKAKKTEVVAELKGVLERASSCIAMDFSGVSMTTFTPFRKECATNQLKMIVVKNTLAKIAAKDTAYEKMIPMFKGMTSLVCTLGKDQVAGAKVVKKFAEKDKNIIVKGGMIDKTVLSSKDVDALSKLPSKEELQAKLLGTMMAVPQGFVRLLAAVPGNFLNLLTALKEKKEKEGSE